ncbi:putative rRNA processing-related protein [Kockovaella imperatae]|uniref:Putative rRNA processing-related protein n=1 Tax=Kockovaella imperatae TaxID=4999 RepID=A0A1Y1ULB8_9TREE|nr:putative rRNA processing-related protein [Kockovaella imperatae]ORX37905.1 putative rRNA processing-related protein [Kockovaella imperatae]
MAVTVEKSKKSGKDFKKSGRSDKSQAVGTGIRDERKPTHAPNPAPAFLSALKEEEVDFPRGGGSSLTALELKQARDEGKREADAEAAQAVNNGKRRKGGDDRRAKRSRTEAEDAKRREKEKDTIRVEELSYKRLLPGTRVLTRIHTVLPLHLILSLPNNLLAHVPITEVSSTLTSLLAAEEGSDEDEDEAESSSSTSSSSPPDLGQLFTPGQYFPAKVLNTYPTASQSFISQYPMSETTRLAAKTELTLVPEKVNLDIAVEDLRQGYQITGEILSEEDKGWRVGLGLNPDGPGGQKEGWIRKAGAVGEGTALIPGQIVNCTVLEAPKGARVVQLGTDPADLTKSLLHEVSDVGSILPGHLTSVLVTAVIPTGLNVKVCGFFDGTIDMTHLGLKGEDIDERFKIGKKIRARVIYDQITSTPRHFSLSVLPHVLTFSSPQTAEGIAQENAIEIGRVLDNVTIRRVIPEWGIICETSDGLEGFVHISHASDDRVPLLTGSAGEFKIGSKHRARVIGHSPLDGVLLLSFERKVLDQVFMQVGELAVGQILKGTIRRLTDKGIFLNIHGSVDGVVWPLHYADIRLKHPEKRFKVGSTVKARVFALEPERNRVVLTLKKTFVESDLKIPTGRTDVNPGNIVNAVVSRIMDKGCIVDLFGGARAFVPQSEASQSFVTDLSEIFFVGKPVIVKVTEVDLASGRTIASVRQAQASSLSDQTFDIGDTVSGVVAQIHPEQVVLKLQPSQASALLSLSSLSNHRAVTIEQIRTSLKAGDLLDDLVVVSKNATSGLVIVAYRKPSMAASKAGTSSSGVSKPAREIDAFSPGQIVSGQIISYTHQGAMVQLTSHLRGRIHPCDAVDDFSMVSGEKVHQVLELDKDVSAYVLKVNKSNRTIELSTRPSRLGTGNSAKIVDKEVESLGDLKVGDKIRGLVKNISSHGLFVCLGREVVARVMIKELFDEYVKDWQSRFEPNQLVSGTITSLDEKKKLVEMSLKKRAAKPAKASAKLSFSDFVEGQKVEASVKKVETYGLFLQIHDSDVSGLCHRSELSDKNKQDVTKALNGFREGDRVKAVIVGMDTEKRRINFSIKPSRFEAEDFDGDGLDDEDGVELGEDSEDSEELDLEGLVDDDEDSNEDMLEADEDHIDDADEEEAEDLVDHGVGNQEGADSKQVSRASNDSGKAGNGLTVRGGFDWSDASDNEGAESSDSESENDEEPIQSIKSKGKGKASYDLTGTATDARPESANEFERALLASPNSSFLWIQYMSFLLQLHEVDKARKIGRQALQRIGFREEDEKLNVWMALINIEIGFGTTESADKVFKEAAEYNDKKTVCLRYAEALNEAGKDEATEEIYNKTVKKFSQQTDVWVRFAEWFFRKSRLEHARGLLPRSMKSLDKSKHVEIIEKFAIMEFKHGDAERGKTLFEELVERYKRRLDLWSVYIDQLATTGDIQGVRGLFERALDQKLTSKKAKFLFKKWLAVENRIGDEAGQDAAKEKARAWVSANVQVDAAAEAEE